VKDICKRRKHCAGSTDWITGELGSDQFDVEVRNYGQKRMGTAVYSEVSLTSPEDFLSADSQKFIQQFHAGRFGFHPLEKMCGGYSGK
jgi:hypothetical protein